MMQTESTARAAVEQAHTAAVNAVAHCESALDGAYQTGNDVLVAVWTADLQQARADHVEALDALLALDELA